ncbi:purine and uridine phosphorylase [Aureobasidium sp. EXF-8846]|nr:purine and uridine phosphorylase [Aureobasidium sp. EXF-8846]
MKIDHEEICWILHSDKVLVDFMFSACVMVRVYEEHHWPAGLILSAENDTNLLRSITLSEDPESSSTKAPARGLKRKSSDDDVEATSRRPVSTEREAIYEYSSAPLFQPRTMYPAPEEYMIGWLCALPSERAAAEAMLDEKYPVQPQAFAFSTVFTTGRIGPHNIVIASLPSGRVGTTPASRTAHEMLLGYPSISHNFMVGIGGGVPSDKDDIRLGDVVVSHPTDEHPGVIQYDYGKAEDEFLPTGHLNSPSDQVLGVVGKVEADHCQGLQQYPSHMYRFCQQDDMAAFSHPGKKDILFRGTCPHIHGRPDCSSCDKNRDFMSAGVKIHYGTIASGNLVIKNARKRDKIVERSGGRVLCFEMEAAGLMNNFPCLVIRGISDYCDSHKNDGWQNYAAGNAAAYTKELLLAIPPVKVRDR